MLNNLDFCEKVQTQLRTLSRSDVYKVSPKDLLDVFDTSWADIDANAKKLFVDAVSSVLAAALPAIRTQAIEAYVASQRSKPPQASGCCGGGG